MYFIHIDIAGRTNSGKTTAQRAIAEPLKAAGFEVLDVLDDRTTLSRRQLEGTAARMFPDAMFVAIVKCIDG